MLPLRRNDGMEPKRRLAYATEIADFYRIQIGAKKNLSRGQNGRVGRVSVNETFFLFGLICFFFATSLERLECNNIYSLMPCIRYEHPFKPYWELKTLHLVMSLGFRTKTQ